MGVENKIEAASQDRAATRRSVLIDVKVRRSGEPWFTSRIADLSVSGFRLHSFMQLTVDSTIWIMLPGFEGQRARILWTRAHESGCVFDRPLHAAILDHIVRMSADLPDRKLCKKLND